MQLASHQNFCNKFRIPEEEKGAFIIFLLYEAVNCSLPHALEARKALLLCPSTSLSVEKSVINHLTTTTVPLRCTLDEIFQPHFHSHRALALQQLFQITRIQNDLHGIIHDFYTLLIEDVRSGCVSSAVLYGMRERLNDVILLLEAFLESFHPPEVETQQD